MASSTIDALFQMAAPRAAEPARGPEAAPFDPALRQALAPRRPAEQPPANAPPGSAPPDDESAAAADSEADGTGETEDRATDPWANDTAEGSAPIEDQARAVEEESESPADEVAISAAAVVAVAATEVKTTVQLEAAGPPADGVAKVAVATSGGQDGAGGEGSATATGADAEAAASAAALDGASSLHAASVPADKKHEAVSTAVEQGERPPAGPHERAMGMAANDPATEASSTQPTEVPAEQPPELGDKLVAEDETPTDASANERGEQRLDDDSGNLKRDAQASSPKTVIEVAAVEAPNEVRTDVPEDAPTAKAETPPVAAATNSTLRDGAVLEKLTAARSVAPAAHEGTGADGGPPVDRARFVQRVEGALRRAQDRDGRLHVRLSPPELGSLRVEIALQNGVLTAKLEAETTAARNLIMENLPALRERLAQQDVRIERFDVDVRRDGGGSGANSGGGRGGAQERPAEQPAWRQDERRGRSNPAHAARVEAAPGAKPQANASGLDIRV